MNYYEHHLGDYMRDTAHLSMLEDAAYRRLLDAYYIRERALPLDLRECCKLARAVSKPERDAVAYVLREFFQKADDGYRQKRADAEIGRFQDKQSKAKRSADARWNAHRAQSEGNANASPDAMRTHMRTHSEGNAPRARPQTPDTRHKTPEATHPTQNTIGDGADGDRVVSPEPEEPPPTPEPEDAAPSSRRGELAGLLRGLGVVCTYAHPVVVGWANGQGVTDDEVREAVAVARMQKGDAPIPVKYLVPIVEEMRRPKAPATPRSVVTPQWWASEGATLQEALRLGLTPHRGEEMPAFRDRIRAAQQSAKNTAGEAA